MVDDQVALFIDFENVAIWAEENYYDLDLTRIMTYLQSRGPVVIKRAYGDWSRFSKYRDDLVDNSIDLVQMYSIRSGKNRADIRLALDAFETAIHRPQIDTIAIVSGDSDFGELASKLREYGRYIVGIGPRSITHQLLVKSCHEFIFLETMLGAETDATGSTLSDQESARELLINALASHGKRGELPVLGAKLKHTMLSMDSTFNEANYGYHQFRSWLEDNTDIVSLYFEGLQMYVAPKDFKMPQKAAILEKTPPVVNASPDTAFQHASDYRRIYSKVIGLDVRPRREILRMVFRKLSGSPGGYTFSSLLDEIDAEMGSKGEIYSKTLLRKVMQTGYYQRAYEYLGPISVNTPFRLATELETQVKFILRAESIFPFGIIEAGLELDLAEVASILLSDRTQTDYVKELIEDLKACGRIIQLNGNYRLAGFGFNPFTEDRFLEPVLQDINHLEIPTGTDRSVDAARDYAQSAMAKRTHDFSAAVQDVLLACRLQLDAYINKDRQATLEDLRWYVASYASVKAGEMAQVYNRLDLARPYYLAFFSLVQEETPLWERMRGLINPMLGFYWKNLARELSVGLDDTTSPVGIAIQLAATENPALKQKWVESTETLAKVNPRLLRRVADNIRLLKGDTRSTEAADTIEQILAQLEKSLQT